MLSGGVHIAGAAQQDGAQLPKPSLSALRDMDTARRERDLHLDHVYRQNLVKLEDDVHSRGFFQVSDNALRMPSLLKELPTVYLEFEPDKAKRIMPLTLIFVLMVAFNNLCLQYVQVSFYQVSTFVFSA